MLWTHTHASLLREGRHNFENTWAIRCTHGCEQYLHGIISIPHACLTFLWYMDMLEYPIFMDAPFRVSPLPFACRPCLAPWGDDYKGDPSEQMINRISMVCYAQDMIIHMKVPRRIVAIEIRQGTSQISRKINFSIWDQICPTLGYFQRTRNVRIRIRA